MDTLSSLPPFASTSQPRLHALYADFSRQKHSNPASYRANVEWWRAALEALVSHSTAGSRLTLTADQSLLTTLRHERVGKPLGLGAAIAELQATRALIPLRAFLDSPYSVYDPGSLPYRVASYVLGRSLWWALEQLSIVQADDVRSEQDWWTRAKGEHVVLALVERATDRVLERQREQAGVSVADTLFDVEGFKRAFGKEIRGDAEGGTVSDTDAKVVLRYLERDKRVLVRDKEVLKFVSSDADTEARQITAVDLGILELKTGVENLHIQVDGIQSKIDACSEKITLNLRQKRQPLALNYLRSRKGLEDLLQKRLAALGTLQATLMSVERAAGDVEIMKSYESSSTTLRALLAHPSLQRDNIDATMDALAGANAEAREVDEAIREGGELATGADAADDAELEAELKALAGEAESEAREREEREALERKHSTQEEDRMAEKDGGEEGEGEGEGEGEVGRKEAMDRFAALSRRPVAAGESS